MTPCRGIARISRGGSFLHTSMGEEQLTGLTLLTIYRDHKFDLEKVVDKFAEDKARRVNFTHPRLIMTG